MTRLMFFKALVAVFNPKTKLISKIQSTDKILPSLQMLMYSNFWALFRYFLSSFWRYCYVIPPHSKRLLVRPFLFLWLPFFNPDLSWLTFWQKGVRISAMVWVRNYHIWFLSDLPFCLLLLVFCLRHLLVLVYFECSFVLAEN